MSMFYVAVIGTVASVGTGIYASNKAGKSAKEQAAGAEREAANRLKLFQDLNPGATSAEGFEGFTDFQLNVNPLDYQEAGIDLTEDVQNYLFKQADKSFGRVLKSNMGLFDELVTNSLEQANYDFTSLPPEVMRRVEGSALSRSLGGPAGLAENLSVENKIRLQQQGENTAFKALSFRQGFEPDILNPMSTIFDLANFERQNQVSEAGIQMQGLSALGDLELQRFGLEAGFQQPNTAGIGSAASANTWNAISQGLSSFTSLAGLYGGQMGGAARQQAPTMATGSSNYATPQYNSTYQNPFSGSTYNPNAYAGSIYYRG